MSPARLRASVHVTVCHSSRVLPESRRGRDCAGTRHNEARRNREIVARGNVGQQRAQRNTHHSGRISPWITLQFVFSCMQVHVLCLFSCITVKAPGVHTRVEHFPNTQLRQMETHLRGESKYPYSFDGFPTVFPFVYSRSSATAYVYVPVVLAQGLAGHRLPASRLEHSYQTIHTITCFSETACCPGRPLTQFPCINLF